MEFPVFHFVPFTSLPFNGQHWEEFVSSTPHFAHTDEIPTMSLLLSRLSSPTSLSLPLHVRCISSLTIFTQMYIVYPYLLYLYCTF